MSAFIIEGYSYGKAEIEFVYVNKQHDMHHMREINAEVSFEGDFTEVCLEGNNSKLLPTGSMVNTLHILSLDYLDGGLEALNEAAAAWFRNSCPQAENVVVTSSEVPWIRLEVDGIPHPHSFIHPDHQQIDAEHRKLGTQESVAASGIKGLKLFKTTSSFVGFLTDEHTTTPQKPDRVLGCEADFQWEYQPRTSVSYANCRARAHEAILRGFCEHHSKSGQHTLAMMGKAALEACPEIAYVRIKGGARDHLVVDLEMYGKRNCQIVFAPRNPWSKVGMTVLRKQDA